MSSKSLQNNKILKPTTIPTIPPSCTVALNTAKCLNYLVLKIILVIVLCLYFVILFNAFEDMKTNIRKPIFEYTEKLNITAENEFSERRQILWDTCLKRKIVGKYPPNAWEFFISPRHRITWCNVFKVGSSTWLYYFSILGGYSRQLRTCSLTPVQLARQFFPRPNTKELSNALTNSLSFLVVREPFERLVSAYKNKFENNERTIYSYIGKKIVKKFRKISYDDKDNFQYPTPTFREFLLYLVDLHKYDQHLNEHWAPVYKFCTPCSINFTLVAKFETFQRDTEYIIQQAGLETLLLNKLSQYEIDEIRNPSSNDTKSLIPLYFSQIDENLLRNVLKIYELDFELFGYNSTKYFEYVQPAPPLASRSYYLPFLPTMIANEIIIFTIILVLWLFCRIIQYMLTKTNINGGW